MAADNPNHKIPPLKDEYGKGVKIGTAWWCQIGEPVFGKPLTKAGVENITEKTVTLCFIVPGANTYLRSDIIFVEKIDD